MSNKDKNHIVDTNKKVSSVEWLIEQLTFKCSEGKRLNNYNDWVDLTDYCVQAKAMHKEEIINTYQHGIKAGIGVAANMELGNDCDELTPDEFYKQTYGED